MRLSGSLAVLQSFGRFTAVSTAFDPDHRAALEVARNLRDVPYLLEDSIESGKNMRQCNIIALAMVGLATCVASAASPTVFSPKDSVSASVVVDGAAVHYEVRMGSHGNTGTFSIDTENPLIFKVADYNFDGFADFSVSHLDSGKGSYMIFRLFVYSPARNDFVEISPKCGDEFINVVLDTAGRTLANSYFIDNEMTSCTRRY